MAYRSRSGSTDSGASSGAMAPDTPPLLPACTRRGTRADRTGASSARYLMPVTCRATRKPVAPYRTTILVAPAAAATSGGSTTNGGKLPPPPLASDVAKSPAAGDAGRRSRRKRDGVTACTGLNCVQARWLTGALLPGAPSTANPPAVMAVASSRHVPSPRWSSHGAGPLLPPPPPAPPPPPPPPRGGDATAMPAPDPARHAGLSEARRDADAPRRPLDHAATPSPPCTPAASAARRECSSWVR